MIHHAYALSSTTEAFNAECAKLRSIFSRLDYPMSLIDSAINNFLLQNSSANKAESNDVSSTVRISLPFKDQVAANAVRKQLRDLSHKIGPILQPVFVSKKLGQDLKPKEIKPSIVNKQCVVTGSQFQTPLKSWLFAGFHRCNCINCFNKCKDLSFLHFTSAVQYLKYFTDNFTFIPHGLVGIHKWPAPNLSGFIA